MASSSSKNNPKFQDDEMRTLLLDDEGTSDEESLFGGDDSDQDPDYILEESEESDEVSAEEDAGNRPTVARVRNIASVQGKRGYQWSTLEPQRRGRPLQRNLVSHLPGARGPAKDVTTPLESWEILITDNILSEVLHRTNEEIRRKRQSAGNPQTYHHDCTIEELRALLGLLYLAGVQRNNHRHTHELWSYEFGSSVYRATMNENRFLFLGTCLRFDDKTTRPQRKESDNMAAVRDIWDMFVANCRNLYTPFEYCTIDEQLMGFRGHCGFRIYMASKPDKYGLKIVMMNDARTTYMINAIPYCGKVRTGNEPVPTYYVRKLSEPIHGTGRNITVDNWFSSVPLFQTMLTAYNLTMVGTLRSNKPEIPPSFLHAKEPGTSLFAFDENKMLVSYAKKSQTSKKNVLILSSMHYSASIDEDSGKPDVIVFYNSTKGGTDTFDKLCHTYTVCRVCNRWPLRIWYGMMDQSAINAMVLYNLRAENKKLKRRMFLQELAMSLIKPFLQSRLQIPTLRRNLRVMISNILHIQPETPVRPATLDRKQRCYFCPRAKDRKTKLTCESCSRPMCDEHRSLQCLECSE